MFPEPAGGAVVQDVASDGQMAGIGLSQEPSDQCTADSGAAELRQERDVDDEDLVAGVVDDKPSGRLSIPTNPITQSGVFARGVS